MDFHPTTILYGKKLVSKKLGHPVFLTDFAIFEAREGLGGLKLDEIDAANSFLMLPMARNGLKWPVKTS